MDSNTTPLFEQKGNQNGFRTSSFYGVTPTLPLYSDRFQKKDGLNDVSDDISDYDREMADSNGRMAEDVGLSSSESVARSFSNASFTTAHSDGGDAEAAAPPSNMLRFHESVTSYARPQMNWEDVDVTPIVTPSPIFDENTPKLNTYQGGTQDGHEPDDFTFVQNLGTTDELWTGNKDEGLAEGDNVIVRSNSATESIQKALKNPLEASMSRLSILSSKINPRSASASPSKSSKRFSPSKDHMSRMLDRNSIITDEGIANGKPVERKNTMKKSSDLDLDDDSLGYLFIIAIHSFNSNSLKNKEDAEICLSFEKKDFAFVHTVDDSGWGEVTLIKNHKRGWVPFNYFSDSIKSSNNGDENALVGSQSRRPLLKLFAACAKFLLLRQDMQFPHPSLTSKALQLVNQIRNGVKSLLEATDCVSRSNELVKNCPTIRRTRKKMLAEWYSVMIKADSYKHSIDDTKMNTLEGLVYNVLHQGCCFFDAWASEAQSMKNLRASLANTRYQLDNEEGTSGFEISGLSQIEKKSEPVPALSTPPFALRRVTEVHGLLFTYSALLMGRLDMVEHNPSGCEILETIVHQVVILLRELLYISKCCSMIVQTKHPNYRGDSLDLCLDPLLSLVSELVSCIKVYVTQMVYEDTGFSQKVSGLSITDEVFQFSNEGAHLIKIISQMTVLIGSAISGCYDILKVIGDFQLGKDRTYRDFDLIKVTPELFIRKCSIGLWKGISYSKSERKNVKRHAENRLSRFSTIRAGEDGMGISASGSQFLQEFLPESGSFLEDASFDKFRFDAEAGTAAFEHDAINDRERMSSELFFENGSVKGASFRALVFMLTDELNKPSEFLVATFLLTRAAYSTSTELMEELIVRFDTFDKSSMTENKERNGQFSSRSSRIRTRRRLICKLIQTWLEGFWDFRNDKNLLPALINFFNEAVSTHLPLESRSLIGLAAKINIAAYTMSETKMPKQLSERSITGAKTNTLISVASSLKSNRSSILSVDEEFIDKYELTKLPSANTSSISLPLPLLHLGTSSLITKRNLADMERLVMAFRKSMTDQITGLDAFDGANWTLKQMVSRWRGLFKFKVSANLIHNDVRFIEFNPFEVAKQLTLIESFLFLSVGIHDLLDAGRSSSKYQRSASPNVEILVDFTNLFCDYVKESILMPGLTMKNRIKTLKAWLNVALSAMYFRNYNTFASILSALQSHAISRLSNLWELLDKKFVDLYEQLSAVITPEKNYKTYRKKLQHLTMNFSEEGGLNKALVPCVPFFALFMHDMTIFKEGSSSYRNPSSFRPNKIINVEKYSRMTKIVALIQFLQVPYYAGESPEHETKRDSIFNISTSMDVDSTNIKALPLLQEFILYELWRVHTLYRDDRERSHNLSSQLLPKER
ncbi:LAMI_0G07580g1_1 [Lachancea mirantina]|uniref:LAMI_0G07580g1_1 n=1 Tax=Lachancea mirantina TaxID=1230905 RepID=A0A1G4K9L8_9SACH|nr:LAMI_0G07580g1_1 [Lachancea mirantina]